MHGLLPVQGEDDWRTLTSSAIDQTQTIKLTVLDNQLLVKSVDDVSTMPFTEFSTLYAVSISKLQQLACFTSSLQLCMTTA